MTNTKNKRPGMTSFEASEDVLALLEMINKIGGRGDRTKYINEALQTHLPGVIERLIHEQQEVLDEIRKQSVASADLSGVLDNIKQARQRSDEG